MKKGVVLTFIILLITSLYLMADYEVSYETTEQAHLNNASKDNRSIKVEKVIGGR